MGEARTVRVRYTTPALEDLDGILNYVATRSPQGAQKVKARLRLLIGLLPAHPLMGARTDDPAIRRLIIAPFPYLLFYEVLDDEIIIHAIRHAARDPGSMPGLG